MISIQCPPEVQATWEKLERFQLNDNQAVFGFAARLARENGWSHRFAERVIFEYKRFLLMTQHAGHPVTPSEEVDQAWHLHMVYTRSYWDGLCREVLERPLHHEPTAGGVDEEVKFRRQYERTLESYARLFGQAAPTDIWPSVEKRFQPMRSRWVDVSRHWLLPKPVWLRLPRTAVVRTAAVLMLSVVALVGCQPVMEVLDLRGGEFLKWYAVCFALAFVASLVWPRVARAQGSRRMMPLTDRYDIAFLGGGGDRVVDAALAALYSLKLVNVDGSQSPAKLWAEADMPIPEDLHEVEVRVLKAVPERDKVSPAEVRKALQPMMQEMQERLAEARVLESGPGLRRLRWLAALPLVVVMLVGMAKVYVGMSRDRPVGFLVVFLIFSMVILLWRVSHLSRRTKDGERLWREFKKRPPVTPSQVEKGGMMGDPAQVAMLVALGGYAALQMPAYSNLHSALYRTSSSDSGGSGGCGSSSGCSGGSSGCGSSGCGGCGGGGGGGD